MLIDKDDRIILLKLARSVIESKLNDSSKFIRPKETSDALTEKRGCFVTLHKNGDLRGCIGTIEPIQPLVSCVEENAVNAAFHDPRFSKLIKKELPKIKIEISVLTVPKPLNFENENDLLQKLKPGIHGVILSSGWHRSTFLPQVWEQLPDKKSFLEHLCIKGGMEKNCWKNKEISVQVYEVQHFSE